MKISRKDNDTLNSLITINIERDDFEDKVNEVLSDYRKKANIPGFRKGHVPIGMIKKQYETAITADEVNKLLQKNLEQYLRDENLNILGNPLPVINEELDWKANELTFDFELGLSPEFEVKLTEKNKITHYKITPSDVMISDQIKDYRKQFGKLVAKKNATDSEIIDALKVANAWEFVENLAEGIYTNIGDSGNKLSGGQKQRLSIARAVLKNPPIMILDEATSALDTESEQLVQKALENMFLLSCPINQIFLFIFPLALLMDFCVYLRDVLLTINALNIET